MNLEIKKLLKENFPELTHPELLAEMASVGKIYDYKSGESIIKYGQYVTMVPLVVGGSLKVVRENELGNEIFLYYLNTGDTCPMSFSCCLLNKKSNIRVEAEDDSLFIGIPIRKIEEWMSKYSNWRNFALRSYEKRMETFIETIDNIAFKKMDDRLMTYLEQKSKATRQSDIYGTHQDIAYDLNASRESISRLLKKLENDGLLKLGRNKIQLINK